MCAALIGMLLGTTRTTSAAPPSRLPGMFLNRADLGDEYYRGAHFSTSAGGVELKGVANAYLALEAGVYTATSRVACPSYTCSVAEEISTRLPPHGWGLVGRYEALSPGYFDFVGVSLFEPDQIKRTRSGGTSRIRIKQKASVALFHAFTGSAFSGGWIHRVPGCKGSADVRTKLSSGEQTARLRVSCKEASVAEVLSDPQLNGPLGLRRLMEALGLKKLKFDFRGDNTT